MTERLLREGRAVRVLEHRANWTTASQGAEVVTGDAVDPGDLGRLLEGAEAALAAEERNPITVRGQPVQDDRRHRHRPGRVGGGPGWSS